MTDKWETRSRASCTSVRSRFSTTESAAAKARAKAEASKARLAFAEEEAMLKLEQAKLEASLTMLNIKKETAAAVAEAEALEAAADLKKDTNNNQLWEVPSLEPIERTKEYVLGQDHCCGAVPRQSSLPPNLEVSVDSPTTHLKPEAKPFTPLQSSSAPQHHHQMSQRLHTYTNEHTHNNRVQSERGGAFPAQALTAPLDSGHFPHSVYPNSKFDNSNASDFIRYLARRELVTTGLLKFNDKPQNYRAWKRSFQSAIHGLHLTSSEEMDLLLKWLGDDSAEHVEQIRAIHINRPNAGLDMIWNRLDQTYGSSEVIEDALFRRIETFPKITSQDYSKLVKLSDLLSELLAAKDEGDLPGLTFLDTARGVNPIVRKLPFNLQEKWASVGASYKRQHKISFPPFSVFVDFISQEANIRNDPSFNFNNEETSSKAERTAWKPNKHQDISVHKTEVFSKTALEASDVPSKSDDCNTLCPLHKKPHPLRKCRAFREKSIEDRKSFLKENHVCFKCCSSTLHIARDCTAEVQCAECSSERHPTVLHPGPAPWTVEVDPTSEHGGEDASSQSHVSTQCTQVCGGDVAERSCSKICLVKVYPSGRRDMAKKVYAILDEQSNRSLVRSQFFEIFSDTSRSSPYTLRTCAGVKQVAGRRATGYEVESLDGNVRIPLPSLIECNDIPNNRKEIPTPTVALHHSHLRSLAKLIPEVDPVAPIMLLLGRDILRVHKVRKQVNGTHNLPYAQKLDLGWVIVGNMCLGNVHTPPTVTTFFTSATDLGRPTPFQPCPNVFHVRKEYSGVQVNEHPPTRLDELSVGETNHLKSIVFTRTKDDNSTKWPCLPELPKELPPIPCLPSLKPTTPHISSIDGNSSPLVSGTKVAVNELREPESVFFESAQLTKICPITTTDVIKAQRLPNKDASTRESDKRWNVKRQSFITFKPIKQHAPTSTCNSGARSNTFWDRWRKHFLPTLQPRRKWLSTHIEPGSVVLLKNLQTPRNEWPFGLVTQTFPSKDEKVRKVEVKVYKGGGSSLFLRPISEIVFFSPSIQLTTVLSALSGV